MFDARRFPRIVLALGIVSGILAGATLSYYQPAQIGIATDVYYGAVTTLLEGGDPYAFRPPDHPGFAYLYPPIVLLAFLPHALAGGPLGAYVLQTAINLATAVAFGAVLVRTVERGDVDLEPLDRALLVGYALTAAGVATAFVNGQVNLQLALAIGAGTLLLERGRDRLAGVAYALAALVKLYPALVGGWLLRRRDWTAVASATATGLGLLLAGVFLFGPEMTVQWVTEVLPREASVGRFTGTPSPSANVVTVRRQIAALAPWIPSDWHPAVAAAIVAPIVLAAYRSVATYRDRLVALAATVLAMLTFFPLEPFYLALAIFPVAPLAYLVEGRRVRPLYLAGFLLYTLPITMVAVHQWAGILPAFLGDLLIAGARRLFVVILPPTIGVWLLLAACVLHQHRAATSRETAALSSE